MVHILDLKGATAQLAPELAGPLLLAVLGAASITCLVKCGAGPTEDPAWPHGFWDTSHVDRPMMGWYRNKMMCDPPLIVFISTSSLQLSRLVMGSNGYTVTIGSDTSPKDFRGASIDDLDELREIASQVHSDLWWAEDECKGLKKSPSAHRGWYILLLVLILMVLLTPLLFTDWIASEIVWLFPTLLVVYFGTIILLIIVLILALAGAGQSPEDLYEEKHARVRELKAEQEFIQDKIKRIEDAQ